MSTHHHEHPGPADVEAWLAERGITTVECCFVDLWGVLGARRLTAAHFARVAERGISMPRAPYLWSSAADIVDLPAAGAANGFPNLRVFPDLTSLRPATWLPSGAVCFLEAGPLDDGDTLVDSRAVLRAVCQRLERAGLRARMASELEFYLLRPDGSALHDRHRPFSHADGDEWEPVLGEIRGHLVAAGVEVESTQTEYGPGQVEINVSADEPVRNADHAALLRAVVKATAARHGLLATFMPMPVQGASGSGHHVHLSLLPSAGTTPVFAVGSDGELNAELGGFVAGVLEWAPALAPVYLPSINAYKRTADYTFAPNRLCWGPDNRSASVRIPPDRGPDTRVEVRIPSADCNPHLASAVLLASGLDGIERMLPAPPPVTGDAYLRDDLPRLPGTLADALAALAAQRDAVEKLVPVGGLADAILTHGARDVAAFAGHVTDWELRRYLSS